MFKTIAAAATAVLLAGAASFGALSASADEVEAPPVEVVAETTPVEVAIEPIVEAPAPEPAPVVEEVVEAPPVEEVEAPLEGYASDNLAARTVTEEPTQEVFWLMPNGGSPDNVTWPQTYSPNGAATCGVWYQVDTYPVSAVAALIADNTLTDGEDHQVVKSWRFVHGGDCPPPPPVIKEIPYPALLGTDVCGPKNDTVTVDPEWIATWGSFVNGPWIDTNYKLQNGKWVVDGSAQIKSEFRSTYIWAGTAGTDKSSFLRWQMYPGTAPFVHQDVATPCPPAAPNGQAVIVTECGEATATLSNPEGDSEWGQQTASFIVNVDGEFYGAYAVSAGEETEVSFEFDEDSGDRLIEIYVSGIQPYALIASAIVETDCEPTVITEVPEEPIFVDECGTENDEVILPEDTEDYDYGLVADGDTVTVTVVPTDEWLVFPEDTVTEWTHTFTDVECPTPPATPEEPTTTSTTGLAFTGAPAPFALGGAALLFAAAGIALLALRRKAVSE